MHRRTSWLRSGGIALVISAVVHGAVAATVGLVVTATDTPAQQQAGDLRVDIDLADDVDRPMGAAIAPLPPPAVERRHVRVVSAEKSAPHLAEAMHARSRPTVGAAVREEGNATPARFALSAGSIPVRSTLSLGPSTRDQSSGSAAWAETEVDTRARLLAASTIAYPPLARQAEIEADLPLDLVVDATGRVVWARAVSGQGVGYGLEEAGVAAIRGYRFAPAVRDGRPVAVRMRWTLQFRLR